MKTIEKIKQFSWAIVLFLVLVSTLQTCSTAKKVAAINAKLDKLATKKEVVQQVKIEGYEISKRILYDNNAIIRTTVRPDDRMNQYDAEIKKLQNGEK